MRTLLFLPSVVPPPPPDPLASRTPSAAEAAPSKSSSPSRRAAWGAADQLLYGLTNFALSIVVAGSVSQRQFGAFSVILVLYTLSLGMVEGLTAEVFSVRYSHGPDAVRLEALRGAAGCALAIGLIVSVVAMLVSALVRGPVVEALPAFAVVVPALYLQDLWRFSLFALGRPRAAFCNDLTWAAIQIATLAAVRWNGVKTVTAFVLAWGAGAVAGAILGIAQARTLPGPLRSWSWLRDHRDLGGRFAGEFVSLFGAAQVVLAVLGASAGLAELARIRAGQVMFSPLQGLLNAVRLSVTSLAVEVRTTRVRDLSTFVVRMTLALGATALLSSIAAFSLPDSVGRALLGDSWTGVRPILVPIAVLNIALALSLGPITALRAAQASRQSLRARIVTAALVLLLGGAGALTAGAALAAWGMATAGVIGLVVLSCQARSVVRALTPRVHATTSTLPSQ